ncbi:hypothetical protein L1785_06440 [Antribacter sp. KLBMP9083]|uniref:Uncharacterized protein n=1 Tax=Antribacter soli TaxID=2910976 RepID=A0AA41QBW8_9MICO|nr:hypothetical protein [Antribacter soli]MCF4120610.1 hypothetical protein [Antribacter soli]
MAPAAITQLERDLRRMALIDRRARRRRRAPLIRYTQLSVTRRVSWRRADA